MRTFRSPFLRIFWEICFPEEKSRYSPRPSPWLNLPVCTFPRYKVFLGWVGVLHNRFTDNFLLDTFAPELFSLDNCPPDKISPQHFPSRTFSHCDLIPPRHFLTGHFPTRQFTTIFTFLCDFFPLRHFLYINKD